MGYWQHRKKHDEAWEYLIEELKPDLAFLQETVPSEALEESKQVLWRPIKKRGWGTGIYFPSGRLVEISQVTEFSEWLMNQYFKFYLATTTIPCHLALPTINAHR